MNFVAAPRIQGPFPWGQGTTEHPASGEGNWPSHARVFSLHVRVQHAPRKEASDTAEGIHGEADCQAHPRDSRYPENGRRESPCKATMSMSQGQGLVANHQKGIGGHLGVSRWSDTHKSSHKGRIPWTCPAKGGI